MNGVLSKLLFIIPVFLALAITVSGAYLNGLSGVDIVFHQAIAERFSVGDWQGGFNVAYAMNHTFYPPAFHLWLAIGFLIGNPLFWSLFLQIVFLPLAVLSFSYMMFRLKGLQIAFWSGLLVLGSLAYVDRVLQAQPHAVDFILLPMCFLFFLEGKSKGWLLSSILMVWNHGLVSISALAGTVLGYLKRHNYKVFVLWLSAVSAIVVLSFYFILSGLNNYGARVDTDQEWLFWNKPLSFIPRYLGLLSLGFIAASYIVDAKYFRNKPISSASKLALISIVSLSVMIPVWAERWLQYSTIPLAVLIMDNADRLDYRLRLVLKAAIILALTFNLMELFMF